MNTRYLSSGILIKMLIIIIIINNNSDSSELCTKYLENIIAIYNL